MQDAIALGEWSADLPERPSGELRPHRSYRDTWRRAAAAIESCTRATAAVAGHSVRGEPLWAVTVEPPGPAHACTLVVAGIHAMEHVGVAAALAILERACGPASPWRDHRLVIVPMVNPDGFRAVEEMLAAGGRRFVRKNARGVDLNRNFAAGWDPGYYLNRLVRPIFSPGAEPLSEPESRAVDAVAAAARPDYAVSLHAFGRYFFYPYASRADEPPDRDALVTVAEVMRAAQPRDRYRIVQLGRRSRLFKACGAEIDHLYERHGALSVLVEIGAGPRLRDPRTWLWPYRWFTPPSPHIDRDLAEVVPAVEAIASLPPPRRGPRTAPP